ncbi:hypothetical protein EYC80_003746 [Monilinia laxa]|uniref:Uncharacterized protein n=1 Tax=Monilinia laxa TaxID=61186 RepID=A0A5N6KKM0_MONLA|nr:hypothetical protein EYC80_003746 [Monilinia laxa]
MVELKDNVEQLIKETDEAFQALGFALGDAKDATRGFQRRQQQQQQQRRRQQQQEHHQQQFDNTNSINNIVNLTRQNRLSGTGTGIGSRSIARTNSISKRNQMQNSNSNILKDPSMADVFKGRFTRVEADEMLTPDRLQQLEEKAEKAKLDNERKASLENAQIEAARNAEAIKDTHGISQLEKSYKIDVDKKIDANIITDKSNTISPTEPFHSENLLPRINNDKTSNSSQVSGSVSPLSSISTDISESSKTPRQIARKPLPDISDPDYVEIEDSEQAFEDLNFPSPPRDSPPRLLRSRSNTGLKNLLPTIPEISALDDLSQQSSRRTFSQDSGYSQDSSREPLDYIQLPSTPYTLTCPLFRHGPIRLEHVSRRSRHDSIPATDLEEALDWTAFQMAISGTMDDGTIGASEESIWEADEAEVDNILDWWTGFGYTGIGRLVKEAPTSRRKRGKSLHVSDPEKDKSPRKNKQARNRDNRATTIGLGLGISGTFNGRPKTPEYRGELWVETIRNSALQVIDQTQTQMSGARRDVVLKVNFPEPKIDDGDNDSLPPSPINLVKIKDEYIPMGYNLGHDLGDFLNWETYHVQSLFGEDEGRGYM